MKALKILGLVVMLLLFVLLGVFFGSFTIDSSLLAKLLSTTLPAFIFGLLAGLTKPKQWLLSGVAAIGYVWGGIGGYPTIGSNTIAEKLIFLISLPIVFAFLGGYAGKRLRDWW